PVIGVRAVHEHNRGTSPLVQVRSFERSGFWRGHNASDPAIADWGPLQRSQPRLRPGGSVPAPNWSKMAYSKSSRCANTAQRMIRSRAMIASAQSEFDKRPMKAIMALIDAPTP